MAQVFMYAPDGRPLCTTNADDGTVSVVGTATGKETARIPTGTSPTSIEVPPDGRTAFVTDFDDGTVRPLTTVRRTEGPAGAGSRDRG